MSEKRLLLASHTQQRLIERLSLIPSVSRLDNPGEPQAETIWHSLSDLEQSFRTTVDELLPKLLDETLTPEQLNDVLLDIGEELRHILYHIKDPEYFGYLLDDVAERTQR